MAIEFKLGDRVRLLSKDYEPVVCVNVGAEGTIIKSPYKTACGMRVDVKFDIVQIVNVDALELVKDTVMFKFGDLVEVDGVQYVFIKYYADGDVALRNVEDMLNYFNPDDVKLISRHDGPPIRFNVGDVVTVDGKRAIIASALDNDGEYRVIYCDGSFDYLTHQCINRIERNAAGDVHTGAK